MKTISCSIALSAIVLAALGAAAADSYNIDPAHSTVGFAVTHMVINTVHGKFNDFSGKLSLDGNELKEASGTIQAKSIDTGIERRDNHLRSADFFDTAKFPTISFQSKRAEKQG